MTLRGKVAIVTGGSSGYGVGIAKILKQEGCKVWIVARRTSALKKVAEQLGVNYIVGNIINTSSWDIIIKGVMDNEKKIDILVNNAGSGVSIKPILDQTDSEIEESIKINLLGHIYGVKRVAEIMRRQKSGIIINISSVCGEYAWPGWSIYSAAKSGIQQFAKCIHNELRNDNIHVTTIIPSWGATDFLNAANLPNFSQEILGKIMKPDEMGKLVAYICTSPSHLVMPVVRIQPMVQEINPM